MVFVLTKIFECILYIAVKSKVNFLYQAQTVKGIQWGYEISLLLE